VLEESLSLLRQVGDVDNEGKALSDLGASYAASRQSQAIAHAERASKLFEESENTNADRARKLLVKWRQQQQ
jgi:hypothetical protein